MRTPEAILKVVVSARALCSYVGRGELSDRDETDSTFCIPTGYMCDTDSATSCLSVALCLVSELCGSRSVWDAHQWKLVVVVSDVIYTVYGFTY